MAKSQKTVGLIAKNQDTAAASVGVSSRELQRWQALGCPGRPRNYVIAEIVAWARRNAWGDEEAAFDGVSADTREEYLRARIEKLRRDTILSDIKIAERSENLVDANQVKAELSRQAGFIRSALEKLERKFGKDALDLVMEVFDELDTLDLGQGAET